MNRSTLSLGTKSLSHRCPQGESDLQYLPVQQRPETNECLLKYLSPRPHRENNLPLERLEPQCSLFSGHTIPANRLGFVLLYPVSVIECCSKHQLRRWRSEICGFLPPSHRLLKIFSIRIFEAQTGHHFHVATLCLLFQIPHFSDNASKNPTQQPILSSLPDYRLSQYPNSPLTGGRNTATLLLSIFVEPIKWPLGRETHPRIADAAYR